MNSNFFLLLELMFGTPRQELLMKVED